MKRDVIVYGVTGGIAAYKAPYIVRGLMGRGFTVDCVLSESARQFVTPLTLQSLTGRPVYMRMFPVDYQQSYEIEHISLAERAKLLLIAPATANCVAKLAHGLADDLISSTVLATRSPVLICPSMNVNMFENRATQENLKILAGRGMHVLSPDAGFLACGVEGKGRLPDPERIVEEVCRMCSAQDLAGRKILITCGPTCEDIDPVRFITNRSTGKMGAALVHAAALRGADVTVISGPVNVAYAPWAKVVPVRSAAQMLAAVREHLETADVLVMAAAVADYIPAQYRESKIKKGQSGMSSLELTSSPDILATIKELKGGRVFVGFAAETNDVMENATDKMRRKGLDMIVANRVGVEGSGFASDTNTGAILKSDGGRLPFDGMEKTALADMILDEIKARI